MLLMILLMIGNSRTQNNYRHVVQGAPHRASKMWQCWKDISLVKLLWVILHHYQHNFNHQYLWTCVDWCWRWRETCCYAELSLPRGLHLINSLLHLSWWYLLKYCPHHIKLLDCCHHHDHYEYVHLQFFLPPRHLCISSKLPPSLSPEHPNHQHCHHNIQHDQNCHHHHQHQHHHWHRYCEPLRWREN